MGLLWVLLLYIWEDKGDIRLGKGDKILACASATMIHPNFRSCPASWIILDPPLISPSPPYLLQYGRGDLLEHAQAYSCFHWLSCSIPRPTSFCQPGTYCSKLCYTEHPGYSAILTAKIQEPKNGIRICNSSPCHWQEVYEAKNNAINRNKWKRIMNDTHNPVAPTAAYWLKVPPLPQLSAKRKEDIRPLVS